MRTFLRVENLVTRLHYFNEKADAQDSQAALLTLLEIQELTGRVDLKRELMKELERQAQNLNRLCNAPDVDASKLRGILDRQKHLINRIHNIAGQVGHHLKDNEFLASIRQRSNIPGGLCDFDAPAYHHWLRRPHAARRDAILGWLTPFEPMIEATDLILELVRQSAAPLRVRAEKGFLNQGLDTGVPYQLIRVRLPEDSPCFPEISAGKHRFSIRFLELSSKDWRTEQTSEDVDFHLSCCAI